MKIEDWNELLEAGCCSDEFDDLFDQIRRYGNYLTAYEQVLSDFPVEVGGY